MKGEEDKGSRANPGNDVDDSEDFEISTEQLFDDAAPDASVCSKEQAVLPCLRKASNSSSDTTLITSSELGLTLATRMAKAEFGIYRVISDDSLFTFFTPTEEIKGRSNSVKISSKEDEFMASHLPLHNLGAVSELPPSPTEDTLNTKFVRFCKSQRSQRILSIGAFEVDKKLHSSTNFNGRSLATRVSMDLFNKDPFKGVMLLVVGGVVKPSWKCVAEFCKNCSFLSRAKIGELLSKSSFQFHRDVLRCFTEQFDFRNMHPDQALRIFLSFFLMAGESQVVFRILSAFSERYTECNRDSTVMTELGLCGVSDIMTLSYSIIMLNVDLHKPFLPIRMKPNEFVRNLKCSEDCSGVSEEYLLHIFESVKTKELVLLPDYRNQLAKLGELYSLGKIVDTEFRQFVGIHIVRELEAGTKQKKADKEREREVLLFNDCAFVLKKSSETLASVTQQKRRSIMGNLGNPGSGQGSKNLVTVYGFLDNVLCVGDPEKENNTFFFQNRKSGKSGPRFRANSDRDFARLCDQVRSCIDEMLLLDRLEKGLQRSQLEHISRCIADQNELDEEIVNLRSEFFNANMLLITPETTATHQKTPASSQTCDQPSA